MSDNSPLNAKHDNNEMVTLSDTLIYLPDLSNPLEMDATFSDVKTTFPTEENSDCEQHHPFDSISSNNASSDKKTTAPVIVKKQIIQRQTVVVRDTVFIIE